MDAQTLGTKTAALVDHTIATTIQASRNTRCGIRTFCKAFRTELAARRAARRVPEVRELDGTVIPF